MSGYKTFFMVRVDSQSRSQVAGEEGWNSGSLIDEVLVIFCGVKNAGSPMKSRTFALGLS